MLNKRLLQVHHIDKNVRNFLSNASFARKLYKTKVSPGGQGVELRLLKLTQFMGKLSKLAKM